MDIDQGELTEGSADNLNECKITTSGAGGSGLLIAFQCPEYFKVFFSEEGDEWPPTETVYSTRNSVAQVKPSTLPNDVFISFIEARLEDDIKPAANAYLKVVDSDGPRINDRIENIFFPNRSIYLSENLILRINQAETLIQVFNHVD